MNPEQLERWLTSEQLSDLTGFKEETILRWAGKDLPSFRVGGQRRFLVSEVQAWMASKRAGKMGEVHELREARG